jgi:hypothetical protein
MKNNFTFQVIGEFFRDVYVEPVVKFSQKKIAVSQGPFHKEPRSPEERPQRQFAFGQRRYVSSGPRRLFVPHKGLMSPVFERDLERPRGILRVVSRCS